MRTGRSGSVSKLLWAVAWLMACALVSPLAAQQQAATAGNTKDDAAQTTQGPVAPEEKVLKEKSVFFPDLATTRKPLTVEEKFRLSLKNSVSPAAFLGSIVGAGIDQATNTPEGYGQGAEGYGKRFGASMGTRASTNVFGGFILPSIAHQDPRFFVRGEGSFGQRLGHAVSRVVVAPKDRGGYGFNWGGVFGPLGAEALANTYQPVAEQTGARTMQRYGTDLATAAGINILKEFWPDIFKHLGLKK